MVKNIWSEKGHMFSGQDLLHLMIPLIVEQVLTALMGTADTMMVARIGEYAVSAVSLVDAVNNFMLMVFTAMAAGGTIVCAQYLGMNDRNGANRAARQVLLAVFLISLLCTVLCVLLRRPLLQLIFGGVEEDVMDAAVVYFLITPSPIPLSEPMTPPRPSTGRPAIPASPCLSAQPAMGSTLRATRSLSLFSTGA